MNHARPPHRMLGRVMAVWVLSLLGGGHLGAHAGTGKLLLTGGVGSIDGAAGGGLTPWATIGSNATAGEAGLSLHATRSLTRDYGLAVVGATIGVNDLLEVSLARQDLDASPAVALNGVAPFGIANGQHIRMDILGVKWRVAGDAVLDSDRQMPQISVGLQHKRVSAGTLSPVLRFLGADTNGTDFYVSASKLLLEHGVMVNATLRATRGNQNGLLGFGAARPGNNGYSLQPEFSVAMLLRKDLAIGVEYRVKPDNLRALGAAAGLGDALREDDWKDIFVAWSPNKHGSLTLAWADLGRIVPGVTGNRRQAGFYLSAQVLF